MTTDPKSVEEALARFLHILNSAQACIRVGELDAAEEQLLRARALEPARADLYDVWAELEDHRARPEEACRRRRTAWELEPTPVRGLALADDLPADQTLEFLGHIVATFPESTPAVVALTRAELSRGGFEAGDAASGVLVRRCPGGSQELMAAMVQVIAGLDIDQEAMDIFQPLVSAEITRRHSVESGALDTSSEALPVIQPEDEGDPFADLEVHRAPVEPPPLAPPPPIHVPEPTVEAPPPVAPPTIAPAAPTLARRSGEDTRDRMSSSARVIHALPPLPPEDEKEAARAKAKAKAPAAWRIRLWPYAPLLALVPALALAFWVGFGDGYDWMIREDHDKLLLYATFPTVCFLVGIGIGAVFERQVEFKALIGGAVGSMVVSSVAFLLLHIIVGAMQPSILVESLMIFGTCVSVWGGLGAVGVKVCS